MSLPIQTLVIQAKESDADMISFAKEATETARVAFREIPDGIDEDGELVIRSADGREFARYTKQSIMKEVPEMKRECPPDGETIVFCCVIAIILVFVLINL